MSRGSLRRRSAPVRGTLFRVEPERFQVHCAHCNTSFAVGTPHCIHCGGRLGGGIFSDVGQAEEAAPGGEAPYAAEEDAPAGGAEGRGWFWIVSALIMLFITLTRACGGG